MDLNELSKRPPFLHSDRFGNLTSSWGASSRLLKFLDSCLQDGQVTLETGAGISTILFAMKGCRHTAIVPDQAQVTRIRSWCEEKGISLEHVNFIIEKSEDALPKLEFSTPIDVYLIDGAHGFPMPFIDWYYGIRNMRVGGLLFVDDVQIWTGLVLRRFLAQEPNWEIVHSESIEFFAARLNAQPVASEWNQQPFVLHNSLTQSSTSFIRKAVGYGLVGIHAGSSVVNLARQRDWAELRRRSKAVRQSGSLG
jgi:predicted O-methyltransferase YrrM